MSVRLLRHLRLSRVRHYSHQSIVSKEDFLTRYHMVGKGGNQLQKLLQQAPSVDAKAVFANADTSLQYIRCYGFDYDYTLATYTDELHNFTYEQARDYLISQGFSKEFSSMRYTPNFAIRGLHYDKTTGFLFKVDQFLKIQSGAVYYGRNPVPVDVLLKTYNGLRLTSTYMEENCHMYKDLFSLAEMCLLSDATQWCLDNNIKFSPLYLYQDIRESVNWVHSSGTLYQEIINKPDKYLNPNRSLGSYLLKLRENNKHIFLLTNSPFYFVDAGMKFLLRSFLDDTKMSWVELFDVVITSARKPSFFEKGYRPFRYLDEGSGILSLRPVTKLERGKIYSRGSFDAFTELTQWKHGVLYAGDQIYADLVAPQENALWKTAAIIREINWEVQAMDDPEFREKLGEILEIESLIQEGQVRPEADIKHIVAVLKQRRTNVRKVLKELINKQFGSVFRTSSSRTMFYYNVGRYADIYTSSIRNLDRYSLDHVFYSGRTFFQHETNLMHLVNLAVAERD